MNMYFLSLLRKRSEVFDHSPGRRIMSVSEKNYPKLIMITWENLSIIFTELSQWLFWYYIDGKQIKLIYWKKESYQDQDENLTPQYYYA